MNKRKIKTIVSLYMDGVSIPVCIAIIIDLFGEDSSSLDKGTYIHMFYEEIKIAED